MKPMVSSVMCLLIGNQTRYEAVLRVGGHIGIAATLTTMRRRSCY